MTAWVLFISYLMAQDIILLEISQTVLLLIWPHFCDGNKVSGRPTGWFCLLKNETWFRLPSKTKVAYDCWFIRLVCSAGGGAGKRDVIVRPEEPRFSTNKAKL